MRCFVHVSPLVGGKRAVDGDEVSVYAPVPAFCLITIYYDDVSRFVYKMEGANY
jgi:hypothetical protein